jgi:RimJ/RimL family protein N-acetyltransferase
MAHLFWPLFDLVVRTPRLELRAPTDDMFVELANAAGPEMFPDGENYFMLDWLSEPEPVRQQHSMQWWWRQRANFSPDDWHLDLAVIVEGRPVGSQGVGARAFPRRRSVSTGSWLAAPMQGKGLGTEMRAAVLHLAFAGLGAEEALSEAFEGNVRSMAVSRAVGYEDNGEEIGLRAGGRPSLSYHFRMTRQRFEQFRRDDIVIENLEPCLPMFGLGPDLAPLFVPAHAEAVAPVGGAATAGAGAVTGTAAAGGAVASGAGGAD